MDMINLESRVSDIIENHPETLSVFTLFGFTSDTKDRLAESVGGETMLKTLLAVKKINQELFINSLNETIDDARLYKSYMKAKKESVLVPNLLAYIPCTLKQYFKENLDFILDRYNEETGTFLTTEIPMGCGSKDEYDRIWDSDNIDDLPDVIISMGFGDFFRKKFVENFIEKGHFEAVLPPVINRNFAGCGLEDPDSNYAIYALHPYIFMIDIEKLGDLPVPRKWDDLLDPVYKDNISIGGHGDEISEAILLHFIKDHGYPAVERLSENIRNIWHGSEMAKHAGSSSREGTAIYVISHFFACSCPRKEKVKLIFPHDGIAASHLYMIVKKKARERVRPITDFVYSIMVGNYFASQSFPVIDGSIDDPVYSGRKIRWIGWDFIKNNDVHKIRSVATAYFTSLRKSKGGSCSTC